MQEIYDIYKQDRDKIPRINIYDWCALLEGNICTYPLLVSTIQIRQTIFND